MRMSNLGPLYIIIAAVFWSFGGLLGKLIPWSGLTIAALRGIIAAVTIGLYRRSFSFKLNKPILLAGISLTITTILFMIANKMTSAANAIVLQYTSPVFIILLTLIIYKQKPKKRDMFAIFGVLVGISIFFFDQFKSGNYIGDLIALGSGLSFAAVFFANKLPNASPIDATYLGNLLSLFILPFVFFDQNFLMNQSSLTWLYIILMGVFQLGFGYIFFSLGIKHTAATTSSIIATLEPILNPIWVFVFIGEVPSLLALVGGVIVLITVSIYNVIVTRDNYKLTKLEN